MANHGLVAIGTSAGGVEPLLSLAKTLPGAFPASILITIHLFEHFPSSLDEVLTRVGPLPGARSVRPALPSRGRKRRT
jgi:two-component system chemotaxis response regulator CheB